jgi:orotidine-5'-phosphate decarboxylase
MASAADPRLIVALDVPDRAAAEAMVERLGDRVGVYKIGLELLAGDGMGLARSLGATGRRTFLDWKLHDIGETVRRATAAIAASGACDFLTVHAEPQVLAAAVAGRAGDDRVKLLGVTVMTSLGEAELAEIGYRYGVRELVERRIRQTLEAGADGVVASPHEAALARRLATEAGRGDFLVVTPGVRPAGAARNDQVRAATPADALAAGASHLVVGRPITAAPDPAAAAEAIAAEMAERPLAQAHWPPATKG